MNPRQFQGPLYNATGAEAPAEVRNPAWDWLQGRQEAAPPAQPVHSGQLADYVQKQRFQARPANRSPAAPNLDPPPPAASTTAAPIRDANGMLLGYAPGTGPAFARPAAPVAVAPAPMAAPVAPPAPVAAPVPAPQPVAAPVAPAAPVSQVSNWGQNSDVTRQDYNPAFGVDFSQAWTGQSGPGQSRPAGWSDFMESQKGGTSLVGGFGDARDNPNNTIGVFYDPVTKSHFNDYDNPALRSARAQGATYIPPEQYASIGITPGGVGDPRWANSPQSVQNNPPAVPAAPPPPPAPPREVAFDPNVGKPREVAYDANMNPTTEVKLVTTPKEKIVAPFTAGPPVASQLTKNSYLDPLRKGLGL